MQYTTSELEYLNALAQDLIDGVDPKEAHEQAVKEFNKIPEFTK